MKKILLSLAVLAFSCVSAFADEVTMKYSGTTTANMIGDGSNEASSLGLDNAQWSVVANKGGNTNAPGLNKAGDFRLYWHTNGSNTITVESLTKATISQIAITFTGDDYSNVSITVGGEEVTGENGVFKINSTSFVIGNANTTNVQVRIKQIVITYTGGTPITVQPPKFSVEGGLFFEPQTVALTCETEGAKILYTIPAGQDPEYTDDDNYSGIFYDGTPLTITKTTTIKAMAVKDGKTSSIVTATYCVANVANAGTEENPFTVADAISVVNALADGATTPNTYFVKGIVIGNPDFQRNASEQLYGNVNFVMADSQDGDLLTIYRAKDYNNANFTEETTNRFKAGDEVVLTGKLQKYVKESVVTPELTSCYLISVKDTATGIAAVKETIKTAEIFNAAGQQLAAPQKGLNIIGGKKIWVK
jgi:hypothetical protein